MTGHIVAGMTDLSRLLDEPRDNVCEHAAHEIYLDAGAGDRHGAVLAGMRLAISLCANAVNDMRDMQHFYADEAGFEHSDHKPEDCREWSIQYESAAHAYQRAFMRMTRLMRDLEKEYAETGV